MFTGTTAHAGHGSVLRPANRDQHEGVVTGVLRDHTGFVYECRKLPVGKFTIDAQVKRYFDVILCIPSRGKGLDEYSIVL